MSDADKIEDQFVNPPSTYRPVPWWCWTGKMEREEMERQLDEFLDKGIHEFFLFPIYGLETPYCSEDYWELVEFTLGKCQAKGMKCWIYDDYNWPSGTCAGYVIRDHPETRSIALSHRVLKAKAGEQVEAEIAGEPLLVKAVRDDGSGQEISDYTWEPAEKTNRISWRNNLGFDCTLVAFGTWISEQYYPYSWGAPWNWGQRGYIDNMNPEAVRLFIEYTHEAYFQRFGAYFPHVLPGFFTDEPVLPGTFPYTPRLFELFQEKRGYDLKPRLHELLLNVGDYLRTRYDFWSLVTELFADAYYRQIREWCDEHGVWFTGHLLAEESLQGNVTSNGDIFETARWMSIPGIDMLVNRTGYDEEDTIAQRDVRGFNVTPKLLGSTARHTGAKRVLNEAFGIHPWALTAQEMKKGTNWMCALGVSLINDNLLPYTITDFRKRMISGKALTMPWWKYYKHYSDYCARICLMHSEGESKAEVAVLFPTAASWCLLGNDVLRRSESGGPNLEVWDAMQEGVYLVTDSLLRQQWCFDFLFERVLADAKVESGKLVTEHASYRAIILPAIPVVTRQMFEKLKEFVETGGLLVAVEPLPKLSPDGDWQVEEAVSELTNRQNCVVIGQGDRGIVFERDLDMLLTEQIGKPIQIMGEGSRNFVASHRQHQGREAAFIANQSRQPMEVEIRMSPATLQPCNSATLQPCNSVTLQPCNSVTLELWDPETGCRYSVPFEQEGDFLRFRHRFEGYEGIFLVAKDQANKELVQISARSFHGRKVNQEIPLADEWSFQTESPNLLLLDLEAKLDAKDQGLKEKWYQDTGEEGWLKSKFGEIEAELDPDQVPYYWMRAKVKVDQISDQVHLVVDSAEFDVLYVNGQRVSASQPAEVWDKDNIAYDLGGQLQQGENWFVLRAKPSKYYSKQIHGHIKPNFLEPVVLQGRFAVEQADEMPAVVPESGRMHTGSWHKQGYPHFAGTAVYQQEVELDSLSGRAWLDLGEVADIVEIWVNGQLVTIRPWMPFFAEITDQVKKGRNQITLKVTNTFGNLLKPCYGGRVWEGEAPAGLLSPCRLLVTE